MRASASDAVERAPLLPLPPPRRFVVYAHPLEGASLVSKALLSWVGPILATGSRRFRAPPPLPAFALPEPLPLQQEEAWELPPGDRCGPAAARLERSWFASGSLRFALIRAEGALYAALAPLYAVAVACDLLVSVALYHVVVLLGGGVDTTADPLRPLAFWLGALLAARAARALLLAFVSPELQVAALRVSSALRALVLQKAMRLHVRPANGTTDPGDCPTSASMLQLYTSDMSNVQQGASLLHQLWAVPLEIIATTSLLAWLLGSKGAWLALLAAAAVALLLYVVLDYLQQLAVERVADAKRARYNVVSRALGRVGTTSVAAALAVVKLHAWERRLGARIADAREGELSAVWGALAVSSSAVVTLYAAPYLLAVTTVSVYCYHHHHVGATFTIQDTAALLATIALVRTLQTPLRALPRVVSVVLAAWRSLTRLESFFELDETRDTRDEADPIKPYGPNPNGRDQYGEGDDEEDEEEEENNDVVVNVQNATFKWTRSGVRRRSRPIEWTLRVPHLTIVHGELAIVRGRPLSGRSSLLMALLGDMPLDQPKSRASSRSSTTPVVSLMAGRVSLCARQPWLLTGRSLRDNILMGDAFDRRRYMAVLKATVLLPDLSQLPAGDLTLVTRSRRGSEVEYEGLKGGAAWRVALARACYRRDEADVFILDAGFDLSSNDTQDARALHEAFARCVLGLLRHKTRIYVAPSSGDDNLEGEAAEERLASAAGDEARTILVRNGVVEWQLSESGEYDDDQAARDLTLEVATPDLPASLQPSTTTSVSSCWAPVVPRAGEEPAICSSNSVAFPSTSDPSDFTSSLAAFENEDDADDAPNVVSFVSVWRALLPKYLSSAGGGGGRLALLLVVAQALVLLLFVAGDAWLAVSTAMQTAATTTTAQDKKEIVLTAGVFALLAGGGCLFAVARSLAVAAAGFRAARLAFDRAVTALLLSRIDFLLFRRGGDAGGGVVAIVKSLLLGEGSASALDDDVSTVDLRLPVTCGALLADSLAVVVPLLSITLFTGSLAIAALVTSSSASSSATGIVTTAPLVTILLIVGAALYGQYLTRSYLLPARALRVLARRAASAASRLALNGVQGASTLRALGVDHVDAFVADHIMRLDVHARDAHLRVYADEWIALRVRLLGVLVGGGATLAAAILGVTITTSSASGDSMRLAAIALAALALLYVLPLDDALVAFLRGWTRLETSVATMGTGKGGECSGDALALVRMLKLAARARSLAEAPHVVPATEPPLAWPSEGQVRFEGVRLQVSDPLLLGSGSGRRDSKRSSSYSREQDGEMALDGVSFTAAPGEKLGLLIVDDASQARRAHRQSGDSMGVSNVVAALCRLRELAGGRILVDGVDLATLGLGSLRSRLAVISLAPARALPSSHTPVPTVRGFLDPFDQCSALFLFGGDSEHDDSNAERFWAVLERVGLADKVSGLERALRAPVDAESFNLVERQRLCVARSLLLRSVMRMPETPKVVVLDMDDSIGDESQDDEDGNEELAQLQRLVLSEFAASTVLTVAHRRAAAVRESERILVVVDGRQVVEAASAADAEALLGRRDGAEEGDEYEEEEADEYEEDDE